MSDASRPDERFEELIGLYLESAASEQEVAELASLARGNPERRRHLARLFMQHGSLAWTLRGVPQGKASPQSLPRRSKLRGWWIAIPIAASLVITALIIRYAPGGETENQGRPNPGDTAPRTLSFQDGVSPSASYGGTRDSRLSDKDPAENRGADPILEVEASSDPGGRPTLLQWDLREIPVGSEILAVEFSITVISVSRDRAYEVHAVKRPWSESEVTWLEYAAGRRWQSPGAKGPEDHGGEPLARFTPKRGVVTVSLAAAGLDAVGSWVNHPDANFGILLTTTDRGGEFYAHAREADVATVRPKLTVTYRPPAK